MKICVVTAFVNLLEGPLNESIVKRAREKRLVDIKFFDLRDFTDNKHRQIDDTPYGGGPGMIIKAEPFFRAVEFIKESEGFNSPEVILMTPQGVPYNQKQAKEFTKQEELIFLCGHYKGVDERVREGLVTREISIGDYILTGGELAAMVVIDSVIRLIPGAISDLDSALTDSFENDILDCPHYTRPEDFRGMKVPEVLLSGHHANIAGWRKQKSLERTRSRREDLFK